MLGPITAYQPASRTWTAEIERWHSVHFPYQTAAAIGLLSLRLSGMWNAHKLALRSTELAGIARASASILGGVLILDRILGPALRLRWIAAAAVLSFAFLVVWRSVLRSWLAVNRRQGRMVQSTLVVGTDARALELVRIAEVHPEAGTRVVAIVGSPKRVIRRSSPRSGISVSRRR